VLLPLLLAALAFAANPAHGQALEGFHVVESVIGAGHGFQFTPQLRLRTGDRFRQLEQVRAGLIVAKSILPKVDLLAAGYYEPTVKQPQFPASYRFQFGGQARLPISSRFNAQPRVLWERLNRTTGLAYRRVRFGGRLTWNAGKFTPYIYHETFLVGGPETHFHSTRSGGGIGWNTEHRWRMEFEYFYDVRRAFWGGDRQVVSTRFQFR